MNRSHIIPQAHANEIHGISSLPRNLFMSYSADRTLKVWKGREEKEIAELHESDGITKAIYF